MENEPFISVIVPTRNRNDLLALCLELLAPGKQQFDRFEVIVTDDGGTAEKLVNAQFPWAHWVAGPKGGPAANRNNGARTARGKWLAFVDDDCLPTKHWLAGIARVVSEGRVDVIEGRTEIPDKVDSPFQEGIENLHGGVFWSCNLAVRRAVFFELGGFDEDFKEAADEDVEFAWRFRQRGIPSCFAAGAVVLHPARAMSLGGALAENQAAALDGIAGFENNQPTGRPQKRGGGFCRNAGERHRDIVADHVALIQQARRLRVAAAVVLAGVALGDVSSGGAVSGRLALAVSADVGGAQIMRTVTHIVPYFAPTIDGVGDYARILAGHLREAHGWESRFVVCDPDWAGAEKAATPVAVRKAEALEELLAAANPVLLHYVGYGYQPRGVPIWLAKGVLGRTHKLVTVFHEIWSKGPPWKSVFYLAGTQKQLVEDFLAASARAFSSTLETVRLLEKIQCGKTEWLPIPSNLPPGPPRSPRMDKAWKFLLFGQPPMRIRAAQWHSKLLSALHARGELGEVLVAGKDARHGGEDVAALEEYLPAKAIRVLGEVSDGGIFSEVDAYLSPHRACDACKSGALMAAMAAGCPAIVADATDPSPLRAGEELCVGGIMKMTKEQLNRVGAAGRDWYLKNADWPIVAARIAEAL